MRPELVGTGLPWAIAWDVDQIFDSTSEDLEQSVSIIAADGGTVIAQHVMPDHAEMIVRAVNAVFNH